MNPYKVLGITEAATDTEVKQAYRTMATKYHPDVGGDAWVFEQVREAYELILTERRFGRSRTPEPANPTAAGKSSASSKHHSQASRPSDNEETVASVGDHKASRQSFHTMQLPLQTETSWFILVNVLDLVLTNVLLRWNAIESNPIANYFLIHFGFSGMIAFKMGSVAAVCLIAQWIATKNLSKARWLLWFGCAVVGIVLVHSSRLILLAQG